MRRPQISINNSTDEPLQLLSEPLGYSYTIPCGKTFEVDVEGADESTHLGVYVHPGRVEVSAEGNWSNVHVYDDGEFAEND